MKEYNLLNIVKKHIEELVIENKLNVDDCNNDFDKLFKLYEIKDLPWETFVSILLDYDIDIKIEDLNKLSDSLINERKINKEDVNRCIFDIKKKWNI